MPDLSDYEDGLLDEWEVSRAELNYALEQNPSSRGMLFGYVAELKLLEEIEGVEGVRGTPSKPDDHDREEKYDWKVDYKGRELTFESKSLQTKTVEFIEPGTDKWHELLTRFSGRPPEDGFWYGRAQVDASDRRPVTLPDGSSRETTLLLKGDFDILAVNLFAFGEGWKFVYAKNEDLKKSSYGEYSDYEQEHLIASMQDATWPPFEPYTSNLKKILEDHV
jgi:hypothetical protein